MPSRLFEETPVVVEHFVVSQEYIVSTLYFFHGGLGQSSLIQRYSISLALS